MGDFRLYNTSLNFATKGETEFVDLTDLVQQAVSNSGIKNGIVHVFAPHATGVIVLTENDQGLLEDIKRFLEEVVPRNGEYAHPSNAHSHIRSMLLPPDKTLPIIEGQIAFGTWQSLMFIETDVYPRRRSIIIQVLGES